MVYHLPTKYLTWPTEQRKNQQGISRWNHYLHGSVSGSLWSMHVTRLDSSLNKNAFEKYLKKESCVFPWHESVALQHSICPLMHTRLDIL